MDKSLRRDATDKELLDIIKFLSKTSISLNSDIQDKRNEELENFLERPSQKPKLKKEGKTEFCHGLLRCQSVKHKSEIFHNRDKNAVQNMLNIVKSVFDTGKRPNIFCRAVNS